MLRTLKLSHFFGVQFPIENQYALISMQVLIQL